MSLDKLKLSKILHSSMTALGYNTPTELQLKAMSRILGGQSFIGIAPEGSGKTTAYVLGVLMRLKESLDEAPKFLILASNEDRAAEIVELFLTISQNKDLHVLMLSTSRSMKDEVDGLFRGTDIVVATPKRAREVYLKLGLNLNRIQTFIIDDAEGIIRLGMQTSVKELARSCGKVQYLTFSTVEDKKLHFMVDEFMPFVQVVEVK